VKIQRSNKRREKNKKHFAETRGEGWMTKKGENQRAFTKTAGLDWKRQGGQKEAGTALTLPSS